MIIKKCVIKEGNNNLTEIHYLDNIEDFKIDEDGELVDTFNDKVIEISTEVYFKFHPKPGNIIDKKNFEDMVNENTKLKARNVALKMFNHGFKTEKEVREKLKRESFDQEATDYTVGKLKDMNIIDDYDYSRKYIRDKISRKGKIGITNDLIRKGIDKETVNDHFNDEFYEIQEGYLRAAAIKKYKSLISRNEDERKIREKLMRFLLSRGYEYDEVRKVINELIRNEDFTDT